MPKKYSSHKEHQLITENFRDFLAEEEDNKMTTSDYQKRVRADRGQSGIQRS